jgi:histidine triad (HIT) family protein
MDCIFCKIAQGEIPARMIYNDEDICAFPDLNPQAPVHILVIPKKHFTTLLDLQAEDQALMGKIIIKAPAILKLAGAKTDSFRFLANCKEDAGQSVWHVHFHILAGRKFHWPPG